MSERKFEVNRTLQDYFCKYVLDEADCDYHGVYCGENTKHKNYRDGYENDVFCILPFWWGDEDNLEELDKPNFLYKPTGLEIEWYKYPFRSSYMNQDLSIEELRYIFERCYQSIVRDKNAAK